jgi:hypothetical protein
VIDEPSIPRFEPVGISSTVDVHDRQLRQGIVVQKPHPTLRDKVEGDEMYLVAGHTGKPNEVVKKGGVAGADGSRANVDAERSQPRNRRSSG